MPWASVAVSTSSLTWPRDSHVRTAGGLCGSGLTSLLPFRPACHLGVFGRAGSCVVEAVHSSTPFAGSVGRFTTGSLPRPRRLLADHDRGTTLTVPQLTGIHTRPEAAPEHLASHAVHLPAAPREAELDASADAAVECAKLRCALLGRRAAVAVEHAGGHDGRSQTPPCLRTHPSRVCAIADRGRA